MNKVLKKYGKSKHEKTCLCRKNWSLEKLFNTYPNVVITVNPVVNEYGLAA